VGREDLGLADERCGRMYESLLDGQVNVSLSNGVKVGYWDLGCFGS
jgi:hypothetical protein